MAASRAHRAPVHLATAIGLALAAAVAFGMAALPIWTVGFAAVLGAGTYGVARALADNAAGRWLPQLVALCAIVMLLMATRHADLRPVQPLIVAAWLGAFRADEMLSGRP